MRLSFYLIDRKKGSKAKMGESVYRWNKDEKEWQEEGDRLYDVCYKKLRNKVVTREHEYGHEIKDDDVDIGWSLERIYPSRFKECGEQGCDIPVKGVQTFPGKTRYVLCVKMD